MTLEEIKTKMSIEAVGRRYMADCCGVSYSYLCNVLRGYYKMTKKLQQKIEGVFRNLEIRKVKEARQPVETTEIVRPRTLEEMADLYKQDQWAGKEEDIFDTNNVQDIPPDVRSGLLANLAENRIVALFDVAKRDLNLDEITVGYYRKYGEAKPRRFFMLKLYRMAKADRPKVECTGRKGQYRKVV